MAPTCKAFKLQLRRAFEAIKASLAASGADFSQVVQMTTFHNCHNKKNFQGDFQAQLEAMIAVKDEFLPPPYSTWNAFCIDRHYSERTVVEIVDHRLRAQARGKVAAALGEAGSDFSARCRASDTPGHRRRSTSASH